MTTRIEDILVNVRDSLSDETKTRWSDNRLLRLINEAQLKIATKAQLLRKTVFIPILAQINEYNLPDDCFLLTRVRDQDGNKVTIKSHSNIDDEPGSDDWELEVGSKVKNIIFDNQNPKRFKIHPIIDIVDGGEIFVISDYGVVTTVEGDIVSSDYGIVVDITTNGLLSLTMDSVYGVVTFMSSITETLKVYYRGKPVKVTKVTDVLDIDDKWDSALKHYIIGMALHDDQDTLNRTKSVDELTAFKGEFDEAKEISSKDNTSRSNYRSSYNPEI